jgi:hypothetical protein
VKRHHNGGSRSLTFDEGFDVAIRMLDAEERAEAATSTVDREKWRREADRLANKITPPARQAASETRRAIIGEARRWIFAHDDMPNIGAFIRHVQALPECSRQYRSADKPIPLSSNAIRTILRQHLGIIGKPGRPKKGR